MKYLLIHNQINKKNTSNKNNIYFLNFFINIVKKEFIYNVI